VTADDFKEAIKSARQNLLSTGCIENHAVATETAAIDHAIL
jgi:hypothetical protein